MSLLPVTESDVSKVNGPSHVPSLAVIMFIAICARALLPFAAYSSAHDANVFKTPDTASYIACAESLARAGSFSDGGLPEIVRTPGYPLLLAPGVLLGHVTSITLLLQLLLGCATMWLVYRTTFMITGNGTAAAIAGLLCAVEPLSVLYCSLLLAETLFATALMLFLYLLIRHLKNGKMGCLVAAACALVAAAYVRPIAYWLPVVMVVVLFAARRRHWKLGRNLLMAFVFLCICAAAIGLWQIRNFRETGYRGFSAITDINMYFYNGAEVISATTGEPYYLAQKKMGYGDEVKYLQRHPDQKGLPRAQRYALMGKEARGIILAHPLIFARGYLSGLVQTVFDPGATDYLKLFRRYREGSGLWGEIIDRGYFSTLCMLASRKPVVFWSNFVLGIALLVYYALAVPSIWARGSAPQMRAAVAATLVYLLVMSGGHNRFRHPVMPLVCVLAGCGYGVILRKRAAGAVRAPEADAV